MPSETSALDPAEKVRRTGRDIQLMMTEIANMFVPGYRITVVCRNPKFTDGSRDMVLTDDTWDGIMAALRIRKEAEAHAD